MKLIKILVNLMFKNANTATGWGLHVAQGQYKQDESMVKGFRLGLHNFNLVCFLFLLGVIR